MSRTRERAPAEQSRGDRALPRFAIGITAILALAALFWACRGAPLGTAVADDYFFLATHAFGPFDPLDSMGVAYYWRPVSRQLYFALVGPWLTAAPWGAVALHAALLCALFGLVHSMCRERFAGPVALAIAVFPLIAEPARALVAWPSGAQYLLPAVFSALALREALQGRAWSAMLSALGAVMSNESAALVLPLLPFAAGRSSRSAATARRFVVGTLLVALVWIGGYALALGHGVKLPAGLASGIPWARLPELASHAFAAALNLEDLPAAVVASFAAAHAALLVIAGIIFTRPPARTRLAPHVPLLMAATAAFVLATLPLAFLLFDWNGWRAWLGAIGLGVAVTAFLGLAAPALAVAFVGLRLVALLIAPPAPPAVSSEPPVTDSKLSFARLARWQRTVGSTHDALAAARPELPRGAAVRYWSLPRGMLLAFQDSLAVQVWYRDPTLTWERFGGARGLTQRIDAMVEYLDDSPAPAVVIEPTAIAAFQRAGLAMQAGDSRAGDSLLAVAEGAHRLERGPFLATVKLNRARAAMAVGDPAGAEALVRESVALDPKAANAWALAAELALRRGDRAAALEAVRRCLELNPRHPDATRIIEALRSP